MVHTWNLPEMRVWDIFICLNGLKSFWNMPKSWFFVIFNPNFQSFLTSKPKTNDMHEFCVVECPMNRDWIFLSCIVRDHGAKYKITIPVTFSKFTSNLILWKKEIFNRRPLFTKLPRVSSVLGLKDRNDWKFSSFWHILKALQPIQTDEKYLKPALQKVFRSEPSNLHG